MAIAEAPAPMTTEQLLALPDDGVERWLIRGQLRERRDPDTTVGIDVIYVSAEVANRSPDDTTIIDGVPVLAVEILSPNNTVEEIDEKIDQYLEAGVPLVWIVNTRRRTVTIHRPNQEPELVNASQELSGEPELPGFRVRAADLFA